MVPISITLTAWLNVFFELETTQLGFNAVTCQPALSNSALKAIAAPLPSSTINALAPLASSLILLTDDTPNQPTRENIINGFNELLSKSKNCKELWLSYSGHGAYLTSDNDDNESSTFNDFRDSATSGLKFFKSLCSAFFKFS